MNINQLSEKLLLQVKMERPTFELIHSLKEYSFERLNSSLESDDKKKAFWINIYNAFFQILRKEKKLYKPVVYTKKDIPIAGHLFSLDDIEHGILRKYRYKYSLGYFPNLFITSHLKKLAVSKIDYRIHFALNCGAKSCPPIASYSPEKKEIHVTRLFLWFLGDFGGWEGIKKILDEKLNIKTKGMKLIFKKYNWEETLGDFI